MLKDSYFVFEACLGVADQETAFGDDFAGILFVGVLVDGPANHGKRAAPKLVFEDVWPDLMGRNNLTGSHVYAPKRLTKDGFN